MLRVCFSERFHAMTPEPRRAAGNWLLDALPDADYERLLDDLKPVSFSLGDVIYESGGAMDDVYFPTTSHVSLLYTMINGSTAEMGLVGNEGVVGIALFMGGDTTPNRAVVQGSGKALKLTAKAMQYEFSRGGEFQHLLLRYTLALITQISQTAVCNRLHPVEQRLCRWLLMTRDRTHSNELQMTQEFISNMLGVRREGVTHAAQNLQEKGLISYVRGHISILDRAQLEASVCECYRVVREEHDRLLSLVERRRAPRRLGTDRRASGSVL
jgi:CRP-like cAMP-binding protein